MENEIYFAFIHSLKFNVYKCLNNKYDMYAILWIYSKMYRAIKKRT